MDGVAPLSPTAGIGAARASCYSDGGCPLALRASGQLQLCRADGVAGGGAPVMLGTLRLTCCRCRRPLLVRAGAHRSSATPARTPATDTLTAEAESPTPDRTPPPRSAQRSHRRQPPTSPPLCDAPATAATTAAAAAAVVYHTDLPLLEALPPSFFFSAVELATSAQAAGRHLLTPHTAARHGQSTDAPVPTPSLQPLSQSPTSHPAARASAVESLVLDQFKLARLGLLAHRTAAEGEREDDGAPPSPTLTSSASTLPPLTPLPPPQQQQLAAMAHDTGDRDDGPPSAASSAVWTAPPPHRSRPPLSRASAPPTPPSLSIDGNHVAALPSLSDTCRQWMRLLAHAAAPHEQPLCPECWKMACLAPLQLRSRRALEEAATLAAIAAAAAPTTTAAAEVRRLRTMCYTTPTRRPSAADALAAALTATSLDAVAANIFGPDEEHLLASLEAVTHPHRAPQRSELPPPPPPPPPSAVVWGTDAVLDAGVSAPSPGEDEAQRLTAELMEVRAQQVSLDRQVAELRDVLLALEAADPSSPPPQAVRAEGVDTTDADVTTVATATAAAAAGAPPTAAAAVATSGWQALAVQQNIREVRRAFTDGDDAAGRRRAMDDLAARLAYVAATPVDALCFSIDVSGPIGLITGLRLGLVPPYAGTVRRGSAAPASALSSTSSRTAKPVKAESEEAVYLDAAVRRQVSYTQLLLSGHTSAAHQTVAGGAAAAAAAADGGSLHVSPQETNAACGYMLLLLSYLAHVNGFTFTTAVLRPAGDRSTVALLKHVAVPAAAASTAPSSSQSSSLLSPFRLLSYLTSSAAAVPTASATTTHVVVDHVLDFYLTDRLLAWRTFGAACVAVAACVQELSDALQESLRCWRVRESITGRRARAGEAVDAAPVGDSARRTEAGDDHIDAVAAHTPLSLPRLLQDLHDGRTAREPRAPVVAVAAAAAVDEERRGASPFPPRPPFRISGDAVDGFSVRHGSVPESLWTLGMKKLLSNLRWCAAATVELERLYAVADAADTSEGAAMQSDA
ncbi:Autophagy protein Apg6 [Novymonas esmeraldas]|uniref:Autophagy protein Apg6 n=1 Tax=Novymonas esmeraldas TaxID=1808958 RepID=A0AAW0F8X2_9TRYP